MNDEAIRLPAPTDITVEENPKNFLLKHENHYYLFLHDMVPVGDPNVSIHDRMIIDNTFCLDQTVKSVCWLDTGKPLSFTQEGSKVKVITEPYGHGQDYVVRVAKITV